MTAMVWIVRGLLVADALALVALPVMAGVSRSDLAGDGMAMAYALFACVVGGVVLGGLAFAWWRVEATWAQVTVAVLVAAYTLVLAALLLG